MKADVIASLRISECYKVQCLPMSSIIIQSKPNQLSYVIYPLTFYSISRCQTRELPTSADQFDLVLNEEFKASKRKLLRK